MGLCGQQLSVCAGCQPASSVAHQCHCGVMVLTGFSYIVFTSVRTVTLSLVVSLLYPYGALMYLYGALNPPPSALAVVSSVCKTFQRTNFWSCCFFYFLILCFICFCSNTDSFLSLLVSSSSFLKWRFRLLISDLSYFKHTLIGSFTLMHYLSCLSQVWDVMI